MSQSSKNYSLEDRHKFYEEEVSRYIRVVYAEPAKAGEALAQSIQKAGILVTINAILQTPKKFGRLRGRQLFGADSPERQDAYIVLEDFKKSVEKERKLYLQLIEKRREATIKQDRSSPESVLER